MKVLVTGANGFVGKNLCFSLDSITSGKDKTRAVGTDLTLFRYDIDTDPALLERYCKEAHFVFHLAGVNRPQNQDEFMAGNFGFTSTLLETLEKYNNRCPVMIASSTQAALDNPYGVSKKAGEQLMFDYSARTGAKVLVYRFPNLFGKWCRPNYNSVVATFCYNISHGLPIQINNPDAELTLVYIDDVVDELLRALVGDENRVGEYCAVPTEHKVTLGDLAARIQSFSATRTDHSLPNLADPLNGKLHATYLSYLPADGFSYPLTMNIDARGSFTEMFRTTERGQFSINISKPGITKGNHWHHTKNEKFLVVAGKGVIRFRKMGEDTIHEYFVSGEKLEMVDIPVGYTHNIENLGEGDMVTFMWSSECFDPNRPDTYFEEV